MPSLIEGPECHRCSATEQDCAYKGGCCVVCTHTFDGNDVRLSNCEDCGEEFVVEHAAGPPRKRCDACHKKKYPEPKTHYNTVNNTRNREYIEQIMAANRERLRGYQWWAAPTGTAHLWLGDGMSHCGMVRGPVMKISIVDETWPCLCKRCASMMVRELERTA